MEGWKGREIKWSDYSQAERLDYYRLLPAELHTPNRGSKRQNRWLKQQYEYLGR